MGTHTHILSAPFISFEIRLICAQILTLILKLILYCIARESSNWLFVDMKFTALLFWVGFFFSVWRCSCAFWINKPFDLDTISVGVTNGRIFYLFLLQHSLPWQCQWKIPMNAFMLSDTWVRCFIESKCESHKSIEIIHINIPNWFSWSFQHFAAYVMWILKQIQWESDVQH